MENTSKRIEWIDVVKFFCIFFVLLCHLGDGGIAVYLREFYTPFYLTAFLFVSGYTYKFRNGFPDHLKKKIKQLIIPWLMFSVTDIILSQFFTLNPQNHHGLFTDLARNFLQIRGYGDGMWFVSALFVAYIPFYFLIKLYEKDKLNNEKAGIKFLIIGLIFFAISQLYNSLMPTSIFFWKTNTLPWHLEYVPYAMFYMYCGYIYKNCYEKISDIKLNFKKLAIVLLLFLVLVYFPYCLDMKFSLPIQIIYTLLKNQLGISFVVLLSKNIVPAKLMLFVGRNTLIYFGINGKPMKLFERVFYKILPTFYSLVYSNEILSVIYSLLFGLFMCVFLIPFVIIVNKFFPFMLGKSYKKEKC